MNTYLKYPLLNSKIKMLHEEKDYLECLISPFEKTFSLSYANMLRRILFSYTMGTAITAVKIEGISSEFESIPGVSEDTVDVIANLKNVVFKLDKPIHDSLLTLNVEGAKRVYASDIIYPEGINTLTPKAYICTIGDSCSLKMSARLQSGVGYFSGNIRNLDKGYMPLDTSFSPIAHVSYRIHTYSHYEEILFHLRTNGSIHARDALSSAFDIITKRTGQLLLEVQN